MSKTFEELLEAVRKLPPMTDEQQIEQKISWAWGNCAVDWPDPPPLTLEKFAATVWRDKWRQMKAERDDLRRQLDGTEAALSVACNRLRRAGNPR